MLDLLHLTFLAARAAYGRELDDLVVRPLHGSLEDAVGVATRQLDAWLDHVPHACAVRLLRLRHISR